MSKKVFLTHQKKERNENTKVCKPVRMKNEKESFEYVKMSKGSF